MTTYSIMTIFWIAYFAAVSYALPVTHEDDQKMLLKLHGSINGSGTQDMLANRYQEVSAAIKKLQMNLNETGDNDVKDQTPFPKDDDFEDMAPESLKLIRAKRYVPDNICQDASIDTIAQTKNGNTYAFKGHYFWKLLPDGVPAGYPKRISDYWDGLPDNLDAALSTPDGKTYFFKGSYCWRYTNKVKDSSYPKNIATEFEGIPNDLDAALFWPENNKYYFFKGNLYWRYDDRKTPKVETDYPLGITGWDNWLEGGIDAAIAWSDGRTYFFKGQKYSRYHDESYHVDFGYPRSTASHWFGC